MQVKLHLSFYLEQKQTLYVGSGGVKPKAI